MKLPFRRLLKLASWAFLAAFTFWLLRFSGAMDDVDPSIGSARNKWICMERLGRVGGRLRIRLASGRLERLSGTAFLLQVLPEIPVGECAFECPAAPEGDSFCRWWGPDEETVAALLDGRLPPDAILAACPYHRRGLVVLRADGRVEYPRWEEFLVRYGEPDALGPDSADPRLRGLER